MGVTAFAMELDEHPDKLFLVGGVSVAAAKLNVIDCDGYGLTNYFAGRCRPGEYQNRECLYIRTKRGMKIVLISGGGKDGDYKLIKGNTYGMAYITEANECHKTFIKEVFDRTLSSSNRKIFHDLNPKAPSHWYYEEVLNFHSAQQTADPTYGYNYGHFTILDNMAISDDTLRTVLKTYDKTSVWYRRDIKGDRVAVEGAIYTSFVNTPERYIVDKPPDDIIVIYIGVDFGGASSGHAFTATGIRRGYKGICVLKDHWDKTNPTSDRLCADFVNFVRDTMSTFGNVAEIFCDSENSTLIESFKLALRNAHIGIPVHNAIKGSINGRIQFYCRLMDLDAYQILSTCKHTIQAHKDAVWDSKAAPDDKRLDNGTSNIDSLDSEEYTTEKIQRQILQAVEVGQKR